MACDLFGPGRRPSAVCIDIPKVMDFFLPEGACVCSNVRPKIREFLGKVSTTRLSCSRIVREVTKICIIKIGNRVWQTIFQHAGNLLKLSWSTFNSKAKSVIFIRTFGRIECQELPAQLTIPPGFVSRLHSNEVAMWKEFGSSIIPSFGERSALGQPLLNELRAVSKAAFSSRDPS